VEIDRNQRGGFRNYGVTEREVSKMYQIYSMLGLMLIVWGVAIWASFPEEQEETG
jgi:hypothetical protein